MRSGLLAVGVILLVLGALIYFVQPGMATTTQTENVATTKYANGETGFVSMYDDTSGTNTGYQSQGLDLATSGNAYSNTGYMQNCTNMSGLDVTKDSSGCYGYQNTGYMNTGYNANVQNSGFTNTAYRSTETWPSTSNTGYVSDSSMWSNSNTYVTGDSMDNSFVNTAEVRASTTRVDGIMVICIYMDEEGNVWPAGDACSDTSIMTAFEIADDADNGFSNTGSVNDGSMDDNSMNTAFNNSNNSMSGNMNSDNSNTVNTGYNTQSSSQNTVTYANHDEETTPTVMETTESTDSGNMDNEQATVTTTNSDTVVDTTTTEQNSGFVNTGTTTTSTGFFGGSGLQTLAVWMMVIGAVLTILGLVLPDATRVTTARTTGAAGRRVTEEEHVTRRER